MLAALPAVVRLAWAQAHRSDIFKSSTEGPLPGDEMSANIVSEMVSRRKVFSTIGLSVAFSLLRHHERRTVAMRGGTRGAPVTLCSLKQAPA